MNSKRIAILVSFCLILAASAFALPPTPGLNYWGDSDGDQLTTMADAITAAASSLPRPMDCSAVIPDNCNTLDVSGDGVITAIDVIMLRDFANGQIPSGSYGPNDANLFVMPALYEGTSGTAVVQVLRDTVGVAGAGPLFTINTALSTPGISATLTGRDPANGANDRYMGSSVFEVSGRIWPAGWTLNEPTGGRVSIGINIAPGSQSGTLVLDVNIAGDANRGVAELNRQINITVLNSSPVLQTVGNKAVKEGDNISFTLLASDPNTGDVVSFSAAPLPGGATLNAATGDFSWTPAVGSAGDYNIAFTASDGGGGTDSETITISVVVGDPPMVSDIPDVSFDESTTDSSLNLDDYVTDADHDIFTEVNWAASGNTNIAVAINAATHVVTLTPPAGWCGAETVLFTATDPTPYSNSDSSIVTVNCIGEAPVVAGIPDVAFAEDGTDSSIDLDDYVADGDFNDSIFWAYLGNSNITVDINANNVVTFDSPPNWFGAENITFTATDTFGLNNSDTILVTVNSVNDAPVIAPYVLDGISLNEDTNLSFDLDNNVSDVDHADALLTWSVTGNDNITINIDPVTHIATFTPDANWCGDDYDLNYTVSDGALSDSADNGWIEVTCVNDNPVLAPLPNQAMLEDSAGLADAFDLDAYGSDVDGDPLTYSIVADTCAGLVAVSIDAGNNVDIGAPTANASGICSVTVDVSDGIDPLPNTPQSFSITVTPVNDTPVVSDIPNVTFPEDTTDSSIDLDGYVTDVDVGDTITWSYSGNTNIAVNIAATNVVTFTPAADWCGAEVITFTATDSNGANASDPSTVTVTCVNDAPVVIDSTEAMTEDTVLVLNLDNYVSDVDNTDAEMAWAVTVVPANATAVVNAVLRTLTITPNADWCGADAVTVQATDPGALSDTGVLTLNVACVNDAPVLAALPNQTMAEDSAGIADAFDLDAYGSDVDGDPLTYSIVANTCAGLVNSVGIDADNNVDIGAPVANANGACTVTVDLSDGIDPLPNSPQAFTITVTPVNDAPVVIDSTEAMTEDTVLVLNLDGYVSDVDNTDAEMAWAVTVVPANATAVVNAVLRTLTITPNADWCGADAVTVQATDPGALSDTGVLTLNVACVNDAPVVIDSAEAMTEDTVLVLNLDGYVSDVDNTDAEMAWAVTVVPANATAVVNGVLRTLTITPNADWCGADAVTVQATDPGALSDTGVLTLNVACVNDAPVVSNIPNVTLLEDSTDSSIDLDVYVTDVDVGDTITWGYAGNANIAVAIGAGNVVTFTPLANWCGIEIITFTATDGNGASDSDPSTVTVTCVNDAPVVAGIPDVNMLEDTTDSSIDLDDYASDVDNTDAELAWTAAGNTNVGVSIDNATHVLTLSPAANWCGGPEIITLTATDLNGLSAADNMDVNVGCVLEAPVVSDIPDLTINRDSNAQIALDDYVSDAEDADANIAWAVVGNTNIVVTIAAGRIADIVPLAGWTGTETLTFTATDLDGMSASDTVVVTVNAPPAPPECYNDAGCAVGYSCISGSCVVGGGGGSGGGTSGGIVNYRSCVGYGGTICTASQTCEGRWIGANDTSMCCNTTCVTPGAMLAQCTQESCDDNNPCTADACSEDNTTCLRTVEADGTACPEGVCGGGTCTPTATTLKGKCENVYCNDGNPCTRDSCNADTGACAFTKVKDGTACLNGTCTAGKCAAGSGQPETGAVPTTALAGLFALGGAFDLTGLANLAGLGGEGAAESLTGFGVAADVALGIVLVSVLVFFVFSLAYFIKSKVL